MKAYLSYFKLKFISGLQYRQAALAGISTQFFFGFVYIMIYVAFYQSGSKNLPMELPQLITYVWLNQTFFALICQFYKDSELFTLIKTGNISYEFSRPKNIYFLWYFKILGQRLANVFLRFISRTVFIKTIGEFYLGVNGLLSNVLSILSLAELGISTAINYSLYKPLSDDNKKKIVSLMNFYKKAFRVIALVVGTIGLAILPFLDVIIKDNPGYDNLNLIYFI